MVKLLGPRTPSLSPNAKNCHDVLRPRQPEGVISLAVLYLPSWKARRFLAAMYTASIVTGRYLCLCGRCAWPAHGEIARDADRLANDFDIEAKPLCHRQRTVRGQLLKDVECNARGQPHAERRNACSDIESGYPGR